MEKNSFIKIIKGKSSGSINGQLNHFNSFDFKRIKRFYHIYLPRKNLIRAFHGHMVEEKYIYVVRGSLLLCIVKLENSKNPYKKARVRKIVLHSNSPKIVCIPKCSANGIESLSSNTDVIFFSTLMLKESLNDDFRFPYDYWGKNVWKIK